MNIEGFGESISNIILDNNQKIKSGVEAFTLMHASDCFTGIGKVKAQKVLDDMGDKMAEMFFNLEYYPLIPANPAYHQLSKTQQAFESGVLPFYQFVKSINVPLIKPKKAQVDTNGKYAGMNVCFSGVRDSALEALIISQGGAIASGVSKKTTHLVVKDVNGTSSKITKARSLGIPIMTIDSFKQDF